MIILFQPFHSLDNPFFNINDTNYLHFKKVFHAKKPGVDDKILSSLQALPLILFSKLSRRDSHMLFKKADEILSIAVA